MKRRSTVFALITTGMVGLAAAIAAQSPAGTARVPGNAWPPAKPPMPKSIALSPQDEMKTFSLPPGFHVELVASEPLIDSPILMDFDSDGRLWVVEMPTFLPDMSGRDSKEPLDRVSVLEDTDGDGVMDKKTVFADGLTGPRALKVLEHGVLVGDPPNLWLMKDTDGDLKADSKELVVNTFGNPNGGIEHNANSLFWAMDNVMYSSEHVFDLKWHGGKLESLPALSRGQWTVSQDDAGRVYRNVNDSPLFVDYTPSRYFIRNPNGVRTRGLYELLIEQADATVYPVRSNRGVNRGYRDPFFREDGSSIVIQGASGPTIYRGDLYPKELRGNAFIPDSPTNLVHRMVVSDDGTGRLKATNGYARGEFLASSDERFRPASLYDGPDGNMYVVDMYRGVVQAGGLWTDYLTDYIKTHDLQMPVGKGRIWRVYYGNRPARRPAAPALSKAASAQLVQALSNPKGWWRDTAQRVLVERGDTSVAPALTTLAASAADWRTKLHALWTLDGLDAIDVASVRKALADGNADVRAAAVRLSERWLDKDAELRAAVIALVDDKNWNIRRQVAASLGAMPAADRVEPAVKVPDSRRYGSDHRRRRDQQPERRRGRRADAGDAGVAQQDSGDSRRTNRSGHHAGRRCRQERRRGGRAARHRRRGRCVPAGMGTVVTSQGLGRGTAAARRYRSRRSRRRWRRRPARTQCARRAGRSDAWSRRLVAVRTDCLVGARGRQWCTRGPREERDGEAGLAGTPCAGRDRRANDGGSAEAFRRRRRDLQEHLHGLSSGRRPRQGEAGRESRRLGVRERAEPRGDDPDSARRQGRADWPDAAARAGTE